MENINLEDLNNESLLELLSILKGMDDELKAKETGETNEKNK